TNDIATDGYTIEQLSRGKYGVANGLRIGFYRVGMLAAGGMLVVAGWAGTPGSPNWQAAYGLGAALLLTNGCLALLAPKSLPRPLAPVPVEGSVPADTSWRSEWAR